MQTNLECLDSVAPSCVHSFRLSFCGLGARQLLPYPKVTQLHVRAIGEERDLEFLTCSLVSGVPLDTFTVSSGDVVSFLLNIRFSDVPADLVGTLGRDSRWHLPLVAGTYNVIYRSCVCRDYSEHLMSRLEREAEILRATLFTDEIESNAVQIVHDE